MLNTPIQMSRQHCRQGKVDHNILELNNATQKSNLKADASYYDAMCAIKLNQDKADSKVLEFVAEYPNSNKKNKAYAKKKAAQRLLN